MLEPAKFFILKQIFFKVYNFYDQKKFLSDGIKPPELFAWVLIQHFNKKLKREIALFA